MEKYQPGDYVRIQYGFISPGTLINSRRLSSIARILERANEGCYKVQVGRGLVIVVKNSDMLFIRRPELEELLTDNNECFREYAKLRLGSVEDV